VSRDLGYAWMQPRSPLKKLQKSMGVEARDMWERCAVDLRVSLPRGVAAEVEEVQKRDPEMLNRAVLYAVTRRTIFDHLATRAAFGSRREEFGSRREES
jgi:hypothetical protein